MTPSAYTLKLAKMSMEELLEEKARHNPATTTCWVWDCIMYELRIRRMIAGKERIA